jgi:hypothetical protein
MMPIAPYYLPDREWVDGSNPQKGDDMSDADEMAPRGFRCSSNLAQRFELRREGHDASLARRIGREMTRQCIEEP